MEENINMTAERSLEIITEQIAQSRRAVSKSTGQSLYISGLCTMGMAVLVAAINIVMISKGIVGIGHFLWFLLPVIIWHLSRKYIKEQTHTPVSFVGSMIAKTWTTFGYFALGFFVIALIWGFTAPRFFAPDVYAVSQIKVAPVIVLLMGMTISITGHILKQHWLVTFGIVAGLGCFVWEHFNMGHTLIILLTGQPPYALTAAAIASTLPCLTIFIFALFGLLLPGLMLKRQK